MSICVEYRSIGVSFFAMNLIGREGKFYCSFLFFINNGRNNGSLFSVSTFLFPANPRWRPRRQAHAQEGQHFSRIFSVSIFIFYAVRREGDFQTRHTKYGLGTDF